MGFEGVSEERNDIWMSQTFPYSNFPFKSLQVTFSIVNYAYFEDSYLHYLIPFGPTITKIHRPQLLDGDLKGIVWFVSIVSSRTRDLKYRFVSCPIHRCKEAQPDRRVATSGFQHSSLSKNQSSKINLITLLAAFRRARLRCRRRHCLADGMGDKGVARTCA